MKKALLLLIAIVSFTNFSTWAEDSVEQEVALLRSDIQKEKVTLITLNMEFTAEEASLFWPVYKRYEEELTKIGNQRVAMMKDYAQNFETMTDEKAKELTQKWFKTEEQRLQLKKKYFEEIEKVLPPRTAARFIQVENRLNMLLDLQLAAETPLVIK